MDINEFRPMLLAHKRYLNGQAGGERMSIIKANLRGYNLQSADLRSAYLPDAQFTMANLSYARLGGAYLGGASFWGANITEVHLSWHSRELLGTILRRAARFNPKRAKFARMVLRREDLCWSDYKTMYIPEDIRFWAMSVLTKWVKPNENGVPSIIKRMANNSTSNF